jgi:methylated-DNA-[protein]-cysteine S-methyltransferase
MRPPGKRTLTAFQQRVYAELSRLPCAKAATYGWLARRIGCGSARAVGQALRNNPDAPAVPCHRVVAADGSLRGYQGSDRTKSLETKRRLLEQEGIVFTAEGRVAPSCLLR